MTVPRELTDLGVKNVVIPPKANPPRPGEPRNTVQRSDEQWTGHGVLTHNLIKISALAA